MPRISVIIPALNEAANLPALLDALLAQTRPPDEIIVADAGSVDGTPELARAHGARVVPGGRPAAGRNAGARAASGDYFLFLDADVLPGPEFVAGLVEAFTREGCAAATCLMAPLSDSPGDRVLMEVVNLYMLVVQPVSPHAPGLCIIVRREVHQAIGGFDETVRLAEDHDYVQRAAKLGEFMIFTHVRIPVSMRRLDKEGLPQLAFKYLWCEMYALAGRRIYTTPFEYEFGAFARQPAELPSKRRLVDIAQLRAQLGRFENPLQRLSADGQRQLERLVQRDWLDELEPFHLPRLELRDLLTLERYLRRRRALIRVLGRPWREAMTRLQSQPLEETITLYWADLKGLRERLASGLRRGAGDDLPDG